MNTLILRAASADAGLLSEVATGVVEELKARGRRVRGEFRAGQRDTAELWLAESDTLDTPPVAPRLGLVPGDNQDDRPAPPAAPAKPLWPADRARKRGAA